MNCKQKEDCEQINFSNWLSNLKNLVLSNGSKNVQNVIKMVIKNGNKITKISKTLPIASGGWGSCLQIPVCDSLNYISFFTAPPLLIPISKTLTFGSIPPSLATSCLPINLGPKLLIFNSKVFLSHKKSLLFKIYDEVILHVICGLGHPQSKILTTLTPEFKKFLCLVIFVYNQSKNNSVLEPRTGHFRGLVGFEAKAKDLKMCPRGQGCPQGLHLSWKVLKCRCF